MSPPINAESAGRKRRKSGPNECQSLPGLLYLPYAHLVEGNGCEAVSIGIEAEFPDGLPVAFQNADFRLFWKIPEMKCCEMADDKSPLEAFRTQRKP